MFMPKTTFAGHPLHPQLVGLPIGLLPFSFVMDTAYAVTGEKTYAKAAHYAMVGATVSALAAGTAGLLDYLAIDSGTEEKRLGNTHGLLNMGVLLLTGYALAKRRRGIPSSRFASVLLGLAANAGLLVSQWYGGHLVYEQGMRVKKGGELEGVREYKPAWDEKLEQGLHDLARKVPAAGPREKAS
jgi:uncharacterized membrane protein